MPAKNTKGGSGPDQPWNLKDIEKLIDQGLTDEQIYSELRKTHGPLLSQPHLMP